MAIITTGNGASSTALSGNVTPALPASKADGDLFVLMVVSRDNVSHSLPAGWTQIDQAGVVTTTQVSWWYAWFKTASPNSGIGEVNAAPTVTHTAGGAIIGRMSGFRGCLPAGAGNPIGNKSSISANNTAIAVTGIDPLYNDSFAVLLMGAGTGNTGTTLTANTGFNQTGIAASSTPADAGGRSSLGSFFYYSLGNPVNLPAGSACPNGDVTASASPSTSGGWAAIILTLRTNTYFTSITQTTPAPTNTLTGTTSSTGSITQTTPAPSNDLTGTTSSAGSITQTTPAPSNDLTGHADVSVPTGSITQTTPAPTNTLTGTAITVGAAGHVDVTLAMTDIGVDLASTSIEVQMEQQEIFVGTRLRFTTQHRDEDGTLVSPTTSLKIHDPTGAVTTVVQANTSTGVYTATWLATVPGVHWARWVDTGTLQAAKEYRFDVQFPQVT